MLIFQSLLQVPSCCFTALENLLGSDFQRW